MTDHLGRDFATSVCMGINYSPEGPKKRHIYIYMWGREPGKRLAAKGEMLLKLHYGNRFDFFRDGT